MSNPVKGEVTLQAGDEAYRLVFSTNALAALEDKLDMSVKQIGALFGEDMRLGHLRVLLWAALFDNHDVSELDAGRIMDAAGAEAVGAAIGQAFTLAFPQEEAKGNGHPPKAAKKIAAGTGKVS